MDKHKNTEGKRLDYLFIVEVIMEVGRLLHRGPMYFYTVANYFLSATGRACCFVPLIAYFF